MKVIVQSVLHSSDGLSSVVTIKRRGKKNVCLTDLRVKSLQVDSKLAECYECLFKQLWMAPVFFPPFTSLLLLSLLLLLDRNFCPQ